MSPEAKDGLGALDARSDLYCLGGTYLYLLSGVVPSDWFDPFSRKPQIPLPEFLKAKKVELPDAVVVVLTRLLEPDKDKRYQTAQEAWKDLYALIAPRRSIRSALALVACGFLLMAALVACGYCVYSVSGTNDQKRFNEARDAVLYARTSKDALKRAYSLTYDVRPEKLSSLDRLSYWLLRARVCIEVKDFDGTKEAIDALYQEASHHSKLEHSFEFEFDVRVLEIQALVLRGKENFDTENEESKYFFGKANEKLDEFFDRRNELEEYEKGKIDKETAAAYYWRARMRRMRGDVERALNDFNECLVCQPHFYDARLQRGDIYCEKARRTSSSEARRLAADSAVKEYKLASECLDAPDEGTRQCLRKTIKALDLVDDRQAEIDACNSLLRQDPKSKFVKRYLGKIGLLEAVSGDAADVSRLKKDEILDELYAVTDQYIPMNSEERAEIWMENAVAAIALGEISQADCERCLESVGQALKENGKQSVYVFNGTAWNAFKLRLTAIKKLRDFSDSQKERQIFDREIQAYERWKSESDETLETNEGSSDAENDVR